MEADSKREVLMAEIRSSLIIAASRAKAKKDRGEELDPVERAALDEWQTFRQGMYKPKASARPTAIGSGQSRTTAEDPLGSRKVH